MGRPGISLLPASKAALRSLARNWSREQLERGIQGNGLIPGGIDTPLHERSGGTPEAITDDALVDIVAQGFDAGVRLGEAVQQDMVAVRLTPPFERPRAGLRPARPPWGSRKLGAALRFLERRSSLPRRTTCARAAGPRPAPIWRPTIAWVTACWPSGSLYEWELHEQGRRVVVSARGGTIVTDATAARELALAGVGVAYVFEPLVRGDLQEGRLLRILPQASWRHDGLFLYFARRASMSAKLRAFLDTVADRSRRHTNEMAVISGTGH